VFPLAPGSGTFARQRIPAPGAGRGQEGHLRRRAAGLSIRNVSAPPD